MRALVTGGGRGIGADIARVLARDGWEVVVCARSGAQLEAVRRWRSMIGVVMQDDQLFAGSIADNISFFVNVTFPTRGQYIVQTLIDSNLFEEQMLTVSDVTEPELLGASEAVN